MAKIHPYQPQSNPPAGFAPPPPPWFAPPSEYAYGQTQPLDPSQAAPNVIVEPQPMVMTIGQDYVPDNMVISIVSIFFCPILGIIATIMANRANTFKYQPGGLEQAKRDAANAEKMAIAALIVGCLLVIIFLMLYFVIPFIIGTVIFTKLFGYFKSLILFKRTYYKEV